MVFIAAYIALVFVALAAYGAYRNSVPTEYHLFEQDIRRRCSPLIRREATYMLAGEKVPFYYAPFVSMDVAALTRRGELDSVVVYYKAGRPLERSEEVKRFEHALTCALHRHQGRSEFVTHLLPVAPYDYYEEVYFRKAPRRSLEVSF
jgi:hypothetical protein